jgi:dipeptidyl aminopeptidase/acylaminoacyl peptidase
LKEIELSVPQEFPIQAEDGTVLQGWIMKPVGSNETSHPLVVEIHGGPHAMYSYGFMHEFQVLVSKGYGVLYTNPRGSHGYGQTFVDAVRGQYGGIDYEDIMTTLDQALETFDWIDPDRLGVTGGSYGGFMTNWIVGQTDRFKAAATQRSISNWISFFGVSDIGYYFTEWEHKTTILEDSDELWRISPLRYVKNVDTPLLILHSENDLRCPVEQAEQLYIALMQLKKETRFVRFPESNHELSRSGKPGLRLIRLDEITDWFDQYLR